MASLTHSEENRALAAACTMLRQGRGEDSIIENISDTFGCGYADGQRIFNRVVRQLGVAGIRTKSFKDVWKDMGISYAGPVPESLLAAQDLEGSTTEKGHTVRARDLKIGDCVFIGGQYGYVTAVNTRVVANRIRTSITVKYETGQGSTAALDADDLVVMKGVVETTGKQLDALVDKAEEVSTEKQKDALVDRIKQVQLKRQKGILSERKKEDTSKSLKAFLNNETRS